ncbi:MAG: UDP-2,3-diacylglucosamine diphosphatase [Gammaproteobacteria bacterium]|nr:UDP-2,3-diacylglucosamine diphosphatase [Gammaproteobacteria bacterium]
MTVLFVSDLHLDATRPAATECFLRFLAVDARNASTLYILGDLFEVWTGDDAAGTHEVRILDALRQYIRAGHRCGFLRGNRDFLVGAGFAARTGATLLPDETLIDVYGEQVLLLHGDTLCTDDHSYQRYRRLVHNRALRALYLALSPQIRNRIAAYARRRSAAANASKSAEIMDVNPAAVADAFRRHGVELMVHGHTHRPATHTLELDGKTARRVVLGAWYEQGSVLYWTESGLELRQISFA